MVGALSVIASQCHLSQRERLWHVGQLSSGRLRPDRAQKGGPCYRGQARLSTTSQSASQTAPLVGEPLAKPFTLRGLPKPPLGRSNGDDRRQWRKQGGAVGAAASRMRAAAKQTLGAATRAVALRSNDGEVELLSQRRSLCLRALREFVENARLKRKEFVNVIKMRRRY